MSRSLLLLAAAVWSTAAAQSFDVASVKRVPASPFNGVVRRDRGNLSMRGVTFSWAVRWAYDLQEYQLQGPEWIMWSPYGRMPRFDIQAKSQTATTAAEVRPMLVNLLAERFALVVHWQDKTVDSWVLRAGPALHLAFVDSEDDGLLLLPTSQWTVRHANMKEFCDTLSVSLRLPVLDETGLGGEKI